MMEKAFVLALLIATINVTLLTMGNQYFDLGLEQKDAFYWLSDSMSELGGFNSNNPAETGFSSPGDAIQPSSPSGSLWGIDVLQKAAEAWNITTNFIYSGYLNSARAIGVPSMLMLVVGVPISFIQIIGLFYVFTYIAGQVGGLLGRIV
jgi:hypothetical protein